MILEPDTDVSWDADEKKWVYITDPADYEQMLTDLDARLEPPATRARPCLRWS